MYIFVCIGIYEIIEKSLEAKYVVHDVLRLALHTQQITNKEHIIAITHYVKIIFIASLNQSHQRTSYSHHALKPFTFISKLWWWLYQQGYFPRTVVTTTMTVSALKHVIHTSYPIPTADP